jgi:hypothetical protein
MVVVPTSRHLTLVQRTRFVEWAGTILTIAGLLFVAAAAMWNLRRRIGRSPRSEP